MNIDMIVKLFRSSNKDDVKIALEYCSVMWGKNPRDLNKHLVKHKIRIQMYSSESVIFYNLFHNGRIDSREIAL